MDEAVMLFEQICNHNSFKKTSMILFLNKRDLFAEKLKKKDMTCWKKDCDAGHDYDACIAYIMKIFVALNKDPGNRQVYAHATCATDTTNVSFVMDSVFDVILQENLRRLQKADLSKMLDTSGGDGISRCNCQNVWGGTGKLILCAAYYTENLAERKVLTTEGMLANLPAVEVMPGSVNEDDFMWLMELGKDIPVMATTKSEKGSFKGNFKEACAMLREMLGLGENGSLGFLYDLPVTLDGTNHTLLICVKHMTESKAPGPNPYGLASGAPGSRTRTWRIPSTRRMPA